MALKMKLLEDYNISPTVENIELLDNLLKRWKELKELKEESELYAYKIDCHDIDEKWPSCGNCRGCEECNDCISTFSGDTEYDTRYTVADLICKIFYGRETAQDLYNSGKPVPKNPRRNVLLSPSSRT